jgi:Pathogenicity locus
MKDTRILSDLESIGPAMLKDFELLQIRSVDQLAKQDPKRLYARLCKITRTKQDPCVLDTFCCAVAQAQNPNLPEAQRRWYWWSRKRKSEALKTTKRKE